MPRTASDMTNIGPLVVDGARPAVARVAALPPNWVTQGQRLLLLVLACDSFDGETDKPGAEQLAAWTGMHRSSVIELINQLCAPTDIRPALLARKDASRGRMRTTYLLDLPKPMTPNRPASSDGWTQPNRPASPDG
ncbi:hypothetical protein CXY01_15190 [Cellulomonas xylanilytica]|uniref:Helix-turn-helix domain-containing protein n=2 Tax=Cellulomonas xylanilytica TaxID=233583 RepID=A0A510V2A8_9CELL|nr:hypothetical protein CXY01_15190 [Cellulomonas xylanilytica]